MYAHENDKVTFITQFNIAGTGAEGLDVECSLWEVRLDGTKYPNDSIGIPVDVHELAKGGYYAQYVMQSDGVPVAAFSTDGAVDQPQIITSALSIEHVVDDIMLHLSRDDAIVMGRGTGSELFTDVITDGSHPVIGVVVRAFAYTGDTTVDWTHIKGRDKTSSIGSYTLFLDPGKYEMSIEKNGIQLTTVTKTVPEPDPVL